MFDVEQLFEQLCNSVSMRRGSNGAVYVALPMYHLDDNDSIALRFTQTEDGRPIVTDCGTTMDHLELMDVNIKNYREKLNAIMKRFGIEEQDGAFVMKMPTSSLNFVAMNLGFFIQAISIIANIDL